MSALEKELETRISPKCYWKNIKIAPITFRKVPRQFNDNTDGKDAAPKVLKLPGVSKALRYKAKIPKAAGAASTSAAAPAKEKKEFFDWVIDCPDQGKGKGLQIAHSFAPAHFLKVQYGNWNGSPLLKNPNAIGTKDIMQAQMEFTFTHLAWDKSIEKKDGSGMSVPFEENGVFLAELSDHFIKFMCENHPNESTAINAARIKCVNTATKNLETALDDARKRLEQRRPRYLAKNDLESLHEDEAEIRKLETTDPATVVTPKMIADQLRDDGKMRVHVEQSGDGKNGYPPVFVRKSTRPLVRKAEEAELKDAIDPATKLYKHVPLVQDPKTKQNINEPNYVKLFQEQKLVWNGPVMKKLAYADKDGNHPSADMRFEELGEKLFGSVMTTVDQVVPMVDYGPAQDMIGLALETVVLIYARERGSMGPKNPMRTRTADMGMLDFGGGPVAGATAFIVGGKGKTSSASAPVPWHNDADTDTISSTDTSSSSSSTGQHHMAPMFTGNSSAMSPPASDTYSRDHKEDQKALKQMEQEELKAFARAESSNTEDTLLEPPTMARAPRSPAKTAPLGVKAGSKRKADEDLAAMADQSAAKKSRAGGRKNVL